MDRSEALRILAIRRGNSLPSLFSSLFSPRPAPRTRRGKLPRLADARPRENNAKTSQKSRRDSGSKEKVMEAWKKVLQANHPDQGGSDYIAAKVNEAKDILLGKGGKGGGPGF